LDIRSGWNVFDNEQRKQVECTIEKENPYLLSLAWPCGPWSPWQRLCPDKGLVWAGSFPLVQEDHQEATRSRRSFDAGKPLAK
jgi:hypothetical protein